MSNSFYHAYPDKQNAVMWQKWYAESETFYKEEIRIYENLTDDMHFHILSTYEKSGCVYYSEGRYDEAESIFRRVIDEYSKKPSKEMIDSMFSFIGLANVNLVNQKTDAAIKICQENIKMQEQILGVGNLDTAESYCCKSLPAGAASVAGAGEGEDDGAPAARRVADAEGDVVFLDAGARPAVRADRVREGDVQLVRISVACA